MTEVFPHHRVRGQVAQLPPVFQRQRSFAAFVTFVVLAFCVPGSRAFAADKPVGDTRDACDGHDPVKFESKTGPRSINANTGPQGATVELPSSTREIYWYCAGTRERSANDTPFNAVNIVRAANGAIHWTFLVRSEPVAGDSNVRVGDTKDACDRSQIVAILGTTSGTVNVGAGEIKTVDLPFLTRQISWDCGKSGERSANAQSFNRAQLERAGNGALDWVFYRTLSVPSVGSGPFIHDVSGNVIGPKGLTQPKAGILKIDISQLWDNNQPAIRKQILSVIPQGRIPGFSGTFRVDGLQPSPSSQLELRVMQSSDTLTVKPVIHGNTLQATITPDSPKLNANVTATFDLEVVMAFPRSQTLTVSNTHQVTGLTMKQPEVLVQHVEIEGNDPGSGLLEGLFKSKIRAEETQFDSTTQALNKTITDAILNAINSILQQLGKNLPPGTAVVKLDTDQVGDIRICPAILGSCQFPSPSLAPAAPRVLGTSTDRCSQEKIWLFDSEQGQFVPVPKGSAGRVVQVDDKRFEWYCGDDSGPDPSASNEEWASGPTGTSQVRVARDSDGRAIHWDFLSWR